MKKHNDLLDQVSIARPCISDWSQMSGDDRTRFCSECNKYVHDFTRMTRQEVERLVIASWGNMCARITRDAAGSILTREPLPLARIAPRRPSPIAAAVLSATLSLGSAAPALAARDGKPPTISSILDAGNPGSAFQISDGGTATINGSLVGPNGAVLAGAEVKLLNVTTGYTRTATTSADGSFGFSNLSGGSYRLTNAATGFATLTLEMEIKDGEQRVVEMQPMYSGASSTGGVIAFDPRTLLKLYDESDLVVVASQGPPRAAGGAPTQDANQLKRPLTIQGTIKGRSRKKQVFLYETAREDDDKQAPTDSNPTLFFLKKSESNGVISRRAYELTDFSSGRKSLGPAALNAYLEHLNQLSNIEQVQHSPSDIAEWLVRLAEDPVTRYEGAHELLRTTSTPPTSQQAAVALEGPSGDDTSRVDVPSDGVKAAAEDARGETTQSPGDSPAPLAADQVSKLGSSPADQAAQPSGPAKSSADESGTEEEKKLGDLLNGAQVDRLANLLFSSTPSTEGDMELIGLFEKRKDPRLAPYLVAQIRAAQDWPTETTAALLGKLDDIINDSEVSEVAKKVSDAMNALFEADDSESQDADNKDDSNESTASSKQPTQPSPEEIAQKLKGPVHAFLVAVDRYYSAGPQRADGDSKP
jgi:hypothetical protein